MGEHACLGIRGHDGPGGLGVAQVVFRGERHGARVESGDLVVVQVGRDEALRREGVGDDLDPAGVDAQARQAFHVFTGVFAHRRHRHGFAAQQVHGVGDVAGAAAQECAL
ncbi:hypothetical protein G6F68_020186 [Rhizopus microsporus]|nr:hypothetical protein G6F68_020186 [Rhizopus microsporus]